MRRLDGGWARGGKQQDGTGAGGISIVFTLVQPATEHLCSGVFRPRL